jgi:hypothetical protein
MILPKDLDNMVIKCVKELNKKSPEPKEDIENATKLSELFKLKLPEIDKTIKNEVIISYINSANLSLIQKIAFLNLVSHCV